MSLGLAREETEEYLRKLFVQNSKRVQCPSCGKVWRILKWERRPPKRLLPRECPYCNPMGITIRGEVHGQVE